MDDSLLPRLSEGDDGEEINPDGASAFATGVNMLNELEGAGLLGLPYALRLCGWGSLACLGAVGAMAGFTGNLLAMCMYDPAPSGGGGGGGAARRKRARDSYAAVGGACFGARGERGVRLVQMANLVSVGVVYLVLVGSSMQILAPLGIGHGALADRRAWSALATLAVLPTVHLGGYKKLAAMSALGLLCLGCIIVLGLVTSAQQLGKPSAAGGHGAAPMPALQLSHLPAAFSIFVFAFSAHGIFPDLEASMARPRLFPRVVGAVFAVNVALKAAFTVVCFLAYGAATAEVVAANYPHTARTVVSVLIVANTALSFPLPLVPVFRMLGCAIDAAPPPPSGSKPGAGAAAAGAWARAAQRTLVVLFCGAVSVAVPNFTLAMGFMGSLTLSFLTFIFPATFYLKLHGAGASLPMKAACSTVVLAGVLGGIAGIASNIALATGGSS